LSIVCYVTGPQFISCVSLPPDLGSSDSEQHRIS